MESEPETQKTTKKPKKPSKIELWTDGEAGFWRWMADIKPRVLHRSNQYEVFSPSARQKEVIRAAFERREDGGLKNSILLNVEPRRHGKSTVFSVLVIYFFTVLKNAKIQLLGSTEDACRRTMFLTLRNIIRHTPKLARMVPEDRILGFSITLPGRENVIFYGATDVRAGFGEKLSKIWLSDWHAHLDLATFSALQASLLDSEDSLVFIDSNTDSEGGHVHAMQKAAAEDPAIASFETSYKDLEDYAARAPAWIDRGRARQLARTSLPEAFQRDILGQRSSVANSMFPRSVIEACRSSYPVPVPDLQAIACGRAYRVGIGLDRSRGLVAAGRSDATVLTAVAKIAAPGGEAEYWVIDQRRFLINTAKAIKAAVLDMRDRYGIDAGIFENSEAGDLYVWGVEEGLPLELVTPTEGIQTVIFPELHRLARERRLRFSDRLVDLESEMGTFVYTRRKGGGYSFGHGTQQQHDDTVYSLAWAVHSLRREVLSAYEIDSVVCVNRSGGRRNVCYLLGGGLQLLCAERCAAHVQVQGMWEEFRRFDIESELTLAEFFRSYVRVAGAIIYQAV